MDIIILVAVAAISAGFAVKGIQKFFKTAPKPAAAMASPVAATEPVPVKMFPQPVRPEQMARGLRVNFTFAGNRYGGWVKRFRGRRVVIAAIMRSKVHLVHRKTHQLTM